MSNYIKTVLFLVISQISYLGYSQHTKEEITLEKLEFSNLELHSIIGQLIENEKKCEYYNCNLLFTILINRTDFDSGKYSLIIESLSDRNIALGLKPKGFFKKKGHLFLVEGDSYKILFSGNGEKKQFHYLNYDPTYQDPNSDKVIVYSFTDDSFTQWEYEYSEEEGTFQLINKTPSCN